MEKLRNLPSMEYGLRRPSLCYNRDFDGLRNVSRRKTFNGPAVITLDPCDYNQKDEILL